MLLSFAFRLPREPFGSALEGGDRVVRRRIVLCLPSSESCH